MSSFRGFVSRVRRRLPRPRQRPRAVPELGVPELEAYLSHLAEQVDALTHRLDRIEERLRTTATRADDAHRLAVADARSIEQLLQTEVELWQAIDANRGDGADQLAR